MAADTADPLFLVEYFREFYAAVLSHRANIEASGSPAKPEDSIEIHEVDILAEESMPNSELSAIAPDGIQALLVELLEQQTQAVLRRGDVREQRRFQEIKYVMAAMADEVMLNLEWFGKEYWSTHLIEERLFGTHDAGSRFFQNLDALLQQRDATRADVLAVYLLAISLGFRGRLRGVDGDPQIAHYRNQAYATLYQRNPALPESTPLFPQAYAHTHGGQQLSWLPQLRPWLLSFIGVGVAYLLISHLIWERRASSVSDRIEELNNRRLGSSAASAGSSGTGSKSPASSSGSTGGPSSSTSSGGAGAASQRSAPRAQN